VSHLATEERTYRKGETFECEQEKAVKLGNSITILVIPSTDILPEPTPPDESKRPRNKKAV
jgi:hypothetical protein